jgi:PhnB protein
LNEKLELKQRKMKHIKSTFFAPQLVIRRGTTDIDFYRKAFGAAELRRWLNDDGTIHVAELSIDGALFHLHEQVHHDKRFNPDQYKGTTVLLGLFVPDVDAVMKSAIAAGAEELSPAQDYEYGYRQGVIKDPFGHHWMIEKKI